MGITVSIGVSNNKIFSKPGSDCKKPDAVTVISEENYREIAWPLPVQELLYVGPATTKRLNSKGVRTIGDLANTPERSPAIPACSSAPSTKSKHDIVVIPLSVPERCRQVGACTGQHIAIVKLIAAIFLIGVLSIALFLFAFLLSV